MIGKSHSHGRNSEQKFGKPCIQLKVRRVRFLCPSSKLIIMLISCMLYYSFHHNMDTIPSNHNSIPFNALQYEYLQLYNILVY